MMDIYAHTETTNEKPASSTRSRIQRPEEEQVSLAAMTVAEEHTELSEGQLGSIVGGGESGSIDCYHNQNWRVIELYVSNFITPVVRISGMISSCGYLSTGSNQIPYGSGYSYGNWLPINSQL
jgi:hypothetical protein